MLKDTKRQLTPSVTTRADQMTAVRDSLGNPLMYVVNFEQGGFCIVSATKKSYPILAHSEIGFFDLGEADKSGVSIWLSETSDGIVYQCELTEEERVSLALAWMEYENSDFRTHTATRAVDYNSPRYRAFIDRMDTYYDADIRNGQPLYYMKDKLPSDVYNHFSGIARSRGCPEEYAIVETIDISYYKSVGPLLNTNWGQWDPYNRKVPNSTWKTYPAGCVAIAMAQIMKYHRWPTRYNWDSMNDPYNVNVASFIYDIGLAVGMNYGVKQSGASGKDAKSAFESSFGYNAVIMTIPPTNDLYNNRPYYEQGFAEVIHHIGIFPEYKRGHAWVVDGASEAEERKIFKLEYQVSKNGGYVYESSSNCTSTYHSGRWFNHTHINWGWEGTPSAWYSGHPTRANIESLNFCYKRSYISVKPI